MVGSQSDSSPPTSAEPCPGWADHTYGVFLPKHRLGDPGGHTAYIRQHSDGCSASCPRRSAAEESVRLDAGVKVVILERRGEAVRVRVHPRSRPAGRVGVVDRAGLRPVVAPSRPVAKETASDR